MAENINNNTLTVYDDKPYFDDLLSKDADGLTPLDKNYLRVLFKPGRSVQTRELNQLQSIFQAQIDRFGKSIFKSNKPIIGGEINFDADLFYIDVEFTNENKIRLFNKGDSPDNPGTDAGWVYNPNFGLSALQISNGLEIPVTAIITAAEEITDLINGNWIYRLFIKYKSSGQLTDTTGNITSVDAFTIGDPIKITNLNLPAGSSSVINATVSDYTSGEGIAVAAKVEPGIYFVKGCAVQTTSKYVTYALSQEVDEGVLFNGYIGFNILEKKVNSFNDKTLLDNAAGSQNEAFIGADRYQINLDLVFSKTQIANNFVEILNIQDSTVIREISSIDNISSLDDKFARRTYEESGHYTLSPINIEIQEVYNNGTNNGRYIDAQDVLDAGAANNRDWIDNLTIDDIIGGGLLIEGGNPRGDYALTINTPRDFAGYVQGFRRAPLEESLTLLAPKALRTYDDLNSEYLIVNIDSNIGNYVIATISGGLPHLDSYAEIYNLYTTSSPSQIGTCKIQTIETLGGNKVRVYLHEINLDAGYTISNITSIKPGAVIAGAYGQPEFTIIQSETGTILYNTSRASSLYPWPENYVNDVRNINITERRSARIDVGAENQVASQFTFNISDAVFDKSQASILALYYDANNGGEKYIIFDDFINVSNNNSQILTLDLSTSIAGSGQLNDAGVTSLEVGDSLRIIYSGIVELSDQAGEAGRGTKKRTSGTYTFPEEGNALDRKGDSVPFVKGGVYRLPGVYHLNAIQSEHFQLIHDGQSEAEYKEALIKPLTDGTERPDDWNIIEYTYWDFTDGNYYTRNSYVDENNVLVDLKEIPLYKGKRLGDVLDLRLRPNSTDRIAVDPDNPISAEIDYYLPRKDVLILNAQGDFVIKQGEYAKTPAYPTINPKSELVLKLLDLPAYNTKANNITVRTNDNRRYTMRDISSLEKRISLLEYYTTLSLLEKNAADQRIYDEVGVERFKNGFITDGFRDHSLGNRSDPNYYCSVNKERGRLYPYQEPGDVRFVVSDNTNYNSKLRANSTYLNDGFHNRSITLRYNEVPWIEQPYASESISSQPHEVVTHTGVLELRPQEDNYADYIEGPNRHGAGLSAALQQSAENQQDLAENLVDVYNQVFADVWTETDRTLVESTTSTRRQLVGQRPPRFNRRRVDTREGVRRLMWQQLSGGPASEWPMWVTSETTTDVFDINQVGTDLTTGGGSLTSFGENFSFVTDVSVDFHMRSRRVHFYARGMKPNSRYYAFFNDINVDDYCISKKSSAVDSYTEWHTSHQSAVINDATWISNSGSTTLQQRTDNILSNQSESYQRNIVSDDNGNIEGWFIIPNSDALKFTTGEKRFELSNSPRNIESEETAISYASYTAGGINITKESFSLNAEFPERIVSERDRFRTLERGATEVTTTEISRAIWRGDDPVAQSFRIGDILDEDDGVCVTSLDLYFREKPNADEYIQAVGFAPHVEVYIVEVEAGYPTQRVVPGSTVVKNIEDISISANASISTTFAFNKPIYLEPNREYAVVIFSPSKDYFVYISDLGDYDLTNTNTLISEQPYVGVLFTSANKSTWVPHSNQDLKFKFNRAQFDTAPAILTLEASMSDYVESVTVNNPGSGYSLSTTDITFSAPQASDGVQAAGIPIIDIDTGAISGVNITNPGSGYSSAPSITVTGAGLDASLTAVLHKVDISTFYLNSRIANLDNTTSASTDLNLNNIRYGNLVNAELYEDIKLKDHYIDGANDSSTLLSVTMATSSEYVSPVINPDAFSLTTRKYKLSNVENESSRYITKQIYLENSADQLDGWLAINRPTAACNVKVYVKIFDANNDIVTTDGTANGPEWWEISPVSPQVIPTNSDLDSYSEVRYTINFEDNNIEFSSFVIKIVFLSSNIADVPSCKDMRFIATI